MPRGGISSTQASPTASIARDRSSTSATIRTSNQSLHAALAAVSIAEGRLRVQIRELRTAAAWIELRSLCRSVRDVPEQWLSEQRGLGQGLLSDPAGVSIIER